MTPSDRELAALAKQLGNALRARGWRLASAESCTGGWIAKAVTDVPGSSDWFDAGFVTYSDAAKTSALGVSADLLAEHGAVSEPVVRAMAEAARTRARAELAVAVSGVAGPGGGSAAKPVGTVWFAWAAPRATTAEHRLLQGDRESIRRQSVAHALERALALLPVRD